METESPVVASQAPHVRPEFVTLPSRGGDAICGLSRSWWYSMEKNGRIRLTRIRQRGALRGRVLLPVDQAVALVRKLGEQTAAEERLQNRGGGKDDAGPTSMFSKEF